MSEIRDRIVAAALEVQDYRAAVDEAQFRSLIGNSAPWDLSKPYRFVRLPTGGFRTEGVSCCGLVVDGIRTRAGQKTPWIGAKYWHFPPPFLGLDIVSCYSKLGLMAGSRKPAGVRPERGDICCIGSNLSTHVFTVVDWDGDTMISVDGGQVDDAAHRYLQRVRVCRRPWPRKLVWCIDAVELWSWCEARAVY